MSFARLFTTAQNVRLGQYINTVRNFSTKAESDVLAEKMNAIQHSSPKLYENYLLMQKEINEMNANPDARNFTYLSKEEHDELIKAIRSMLDKAENNHKYSAY